MSNEQCGMCWDLKFDKNGNQTHGLKHHDFIPLDYCAKCGKPQYDQYGQLTHPYVVHDFSQVQIIGLPHKFISTIKERTKGKKQKHRKFLAFIGMSSISVFGILSYAGHLFLFP